MEAHGSQDGIDTSQSKTSKSDIELHGRIWEDVWEDEHGMYFVGRSVGSLAARLTESSQSQQSRVRVESESTAQVKPEDENRDAMEAHGSQEGIDTSQNKTSKPDIVLRGRIWGVLGRTLDGVESESTAQVKPEDEHQDATEAHVSQDGNDTSQNKTSELNIVIEEDIIVDTFDRVGSESTAQVKPEAESQDAIEAHGSQDGEDTSQPSETQPSDTQPSDTRPSQPSRPSQTSQPDIVIEEDVIIID
jgi:hypothetical protein